jgi:metallo-beta-lactamase family protein
VKLPLAKKKDGIMVSFADEYASEDVTGSGVFIETPNYKILLDCGLRQSNNKCNDFLDNMKKPKAYKAKDLDFVFISHQHSDHSLRTPKLYKDGFRGTTIVPEKNKAILKIMAEDSANITERDVLLINNQYNKHYEPLYDLSDVATMLEYTLEFPVNKKIFINDEISFMFIPSGHLLGGCQIILYITVNGVTKSIGYTGDIGNRVVKNYFVGTFEPISCYCDVLIGESTYGDRPDIKTGIKERNNDLDKLKSIIDTQVKEMNGRLLIPSFAQSRCQALVAMIYQLYKDKAWQPDVYVDSPLAIQIFNEYEKLLDGEDKELFDEVIRWSKLHFVNETDESKMLVSSTTPCVIISTAGMCQVGRVRHHIKSLIGNQNATILFVGFSTEGSLASLLKDPKRKAITIDEKEYKCRCSTYSLKSMSGHSPFNQLLNYYSEINTPKIILHHGSTEAKNTFADALKDELSKKCKTTRVVIANSSLKFML